jgi:hypothetical protein
MHKRRPRRRSLGHPDGARQAARYTPSNHPAHTCAHPTALCVRIQSGIEGKTDPTHYTRSEALFCKGRAQLSHKRADAQPSLTERGARSWLHNRGASAQGTGANVEENERQANVRTWRVQHLPISRGGRGGWLAPPFWPDFLGGSRQATQRAGPMPEKLTRHYAPSKIWPNSRQSEEPGHCRTSPTRSSAKVRIAPPPKCFPDHRIGV